jgi:hypothetical protein
MGTLPWQSIVSGLLVLSVGVAYRLTRPRTPPGARP